MEYEINATPGRIETWTSKRLSYDNQNHDEYRHKLAAALAKMMVGENEILHGTYFGPNDSPRDHFDVENILFYNVRQPGDAGRKSCFSGAASNGVSFEFKKHEDCRTIYEFVSAKDHVSYDRLLMNESEISVGAVNSSTKPWQVWQWVNEWLDEANLDALDWDSKEFGLEIQLGNVTGNFASIVKPVFDGVISALHAASDVPTQVVCRIAERVGHDEHVVQSWLSRAQPITISDQAPVMLRGTGLQWSPDDHLCTFGSIRPMLSDSKIMRIRIWT